MASTDFTLVDAHAHLSPQADAAHALIAQMDRNRIQRTVVVNGGNVTPRDLSRQIRHGGENNVAVDNAGLRQTCDLYPKRLLPFFFGNPLRNTDEYRVTGRNFHGLKLGPAVHGVGLTDPRTAAFIEVAQSLGHVVYLHCLSRDGFDVEALVCLAKDFPKVKFILGHAGIGQCDYYGVSLIAPYAHISLETSGGFSALIKQACLELGRDRVIFGSEYPLQDPALELYKLEKLGLSETDFARITRLNILSLIGEVPS